MANTDVKIEIYKKGEINGTLDMYAKTRFPLALNYGIKNIKNINETTGSYSKTIKIPATKNNNKVLKNIGFDNVINYESLLDNSIQCRVSQNSNVLIVGSLQVKSIITAERIEEYQVTILGSNITWGKVFAEEYMCEVSDKYDSNNFTYTWSNTLWKFANDNLISPFTDAVWCLPVICWGEWEKQSYTLGNIKKMDLMEVRPAYFVKALLKDYFNAAGYKLESKFFNTLEFQKLIMPTSHEDWIKDNILGHATKEVRAEFTGLNLRTQSGHQTNLEARWIRRYVYHNEPEWWQSGVNKLMPFDVEHKDLGNDQQLAQHDYPYTQTVSEGYPIRWGFTYDEGLNNNQPAPYHSWKCPVDGEYEIRSNISIGRLHGSQVYASIVVFRDLTINDIPHKYNGLSNPPVAQEQNPIFRRMCIGNTSHDPIQLVAKTLDDDLGHLIGQDSTYIQYKHVEYQTIELNSGKVQLYKDDEVCVFITNLEANTYLNYGNQADQMCWALHENTPEIIGTDQHLSIYTGQNRVLKINNYPSSGKLAKTIFEVDRVGRVSYGDRIKIKNFLPCDVTKIDLVKAVTGMFNLYWDTDELGKTVYCEPYNSFYKGRNEAINMTDLIDLSKPMTTSFILDDLKKQLYFKYAKDSQDNYVDEIEKELGQEFHSLEIDMQDGFLDEVQVLGNEITAPTYMIKDWELTRDERDSPRIPLIVGEYVEDISHNTKPPRLESHHMRILSYEGMKTFQSIGYGSWDWQNGSNGAVSEYPSASTFHDTDTSYNNLDYDDRAIPGLYNTYWANFINNISNNPRIKSVFLNLSAKQISQLDLSKPIYLEDYGNGNGSYWIIQRIVDYKPAENESTKVELLKYDNAIIKLKQKKRRVIQTEGKTKDNVSTRISLPDNSSSGYKNEGLIVKGNNLSPKNNGNVILGNHLNTRKQNQVLLGQYNKQDDDAILIIGGGTSETDRHNVLTVSSDGTVHMGENGGGGGMVTKDDNGNIVDLYTEEKNDTIIKVIKG